MEKFEAFHNEKMKVTRGNARGSEGPQGTVNDCICLAAA